MEDYTNDLTAFLENPNGFSDAVPDAFKSIEKEQSAAPDDSHGAIPPPFDERSISNAQPPESSSKVTETINNSMANEQTAFTMPEISKDETASFKEQNKAIEEIFIKQKLSKLKEKKPEFQYGNIIKEIPNTEITFEQLRIEMQNEIVALEQSKKVSRTVK